MFIPVVPAILAKNKRHVQSIPKEYVFGLLIIVMIVLQKFFVQCIANLRFK